MAGPSIMVRVLGDLSGLAKSFQDAAGKGQSAAGALHAGFSSMLAAVNKTGVLGPFGEALDGVNDAIGTIAEHAKDIGPAMAGVGAAVAGIGVVLTGLGSKDKAAHQQLQAAVEATGKDYDDYAGRVESAIKSQEKFGHSADETQNALQILTQATNDPAKALQYLSTASDLAAAKHESLTAAANTLGKAYNGNTKVLKEFGVQVTTTAKTTSAAASATKASEAADKALAAAKQHLSDLEAVDAGKKHLTTAEAIALTNAQNKVKDATTTAQVAHQKLSEAQDAARKASQNQGAAVDILGTKLKGQASAAADTFGGRISAVKAHFEDLAANLGQKYGPAITGVGTAMAGVGGAITAAQGIMKTFSGAQKDVQVATEGVAAAQDAEAAASWLSLGPILLIIAAIAALVVIAFVIYKNWNTIWTAMKAVVVDAWDWIKNNWPLLLAIILGPVAIAALEIAKHWQTILDGAKSVWNWLKSVWASVYTFLTVPIAAAVNWITAQWHRITDGLAAALNWIRSVWNTVYSAIVNPVSAGLSWVEGAFNSLVGFITGLPGRIGGSLDHVFDGLWNGFRNIVNRLIDGWNSLKFSLPSIDTHIPGIGKIGGTTFGVPSIPHLAQGGLITSTGLVLAHAGEVISPTPRGAGGPAVVVQNAHFVNDIDIEMFMRKVAWIVQMKKI